MTAHRSAILALALSILPVSRALAIPDPGPPGIPEQSFQTVHSVIEDLYAAVSFDPGESPDWDRVRSFFLPEAVVVVAPRGTSPAQVMDLDAFIADFETFYDARDIATHGFRETVAGTEVTEYANIAHAFVVFEPRIGPRRDGPTVPGLDSIDLVRMDGRWWIASITTQFSSEEAPIPERFRRR
jgi:hypothetical protein